MGTAEPGEPATEYDARHDGFYSLSRDGDSGTVESWWNIGFWEVSIRCREMGTAEHYLQQAQDAGCRSLYSLSRDGDSGTVGSCGYTEKRPRVSIRCREMGTAELEVLEGVLAVCHVSIRCREMGTAELAVQDAKISAQKFLFAVARWGQRNLTAKPKAGYELTSFYSLSRDGDSGTH